jgi:hypothetical protein
MTKEIWHNLRLICKPLSLAGRSQVAHEWRLSGRGPATFTPENIAALTQEDQVDDEEYIKRTRVLLSKDLAKEADIQEPQLEEKEYKITIPGTANLSLPRSLAAVLDDLDTPEGATSIRGLATKKNMNTIIELNTEFYSDDKGVIMCNVASPDCSQTYKVSKKCQKGNAVGFCLGCAKPVCSRHAFVPEDFLKLPKLAVMQCSPDCIDSAIKRAIYESLNTHDGAFNSINMRTTITMAIEAAEHWNEMPSATKVRQGWTYKNWLHGKEKIPKILAKD